jgi:hypothetical protein
MMVYVRLTAEYRVESDNADDLADACSSLLGAVGEAGADRENAKVESLDVKVEEYTAIQWAADRLIKACADCPISAALKKARGL